MQVLLGSQLALLRVAQMAEADRLTIAVGTHFIALMESAGCAVAREIMRRWKVRRVIVLCGPGNNGGDGFVAARHLAEAGWALRIALLGDRDDLSGAARHHAERWRGAVEVLGADSREGAGLVVDALFGSGLSRPLEGSAADILDAAGRSGLPLVNRRQVGRNCHS